MGVPVIVKFYYQPSAYTCMSYIYNLHYLLICLLLICNTLFDVLLLKCHYITVYEVFFLTQWCMKLIVSLSNIFFINYQSLKKKNQCVIRLCSIVMINEINKILDKILVAYDHKVTALFIIHP